MLSFQKLMIMHEKSYCTILSYGWWVGMELRRSQIYLTYIFQYLIILEHNKKKKQEELNFKN